MTATEQAAEDVVDAYLQDMTAEQQSFFDPWVQGELEAGRIPKDPDVFTLRTIVRSWLGGWSASHMHLVQGVHDL